MHTTNIKAFTHTHEATGVHGGSERRTWFVVVLTGLTMVVELVAGYWTGSMALVADGWHMATHVGALSLAGLAYWYARRQSHTEKFTFGGGKVYSLAGYTNAILLGVVAAAMIVQSALRLREPVEINFSAALPVAVVGLLVNVVSMLILGHRHDHDEHEEHGHEDHNLRGAYLHVAADALTSVLAIGALLAGLYAGWTFMDPVMGIIGGLVILRWGWGLMREASRALLDAVPSQEAATQIRARIESMDDARVADLHLWDLSPGRRACIVSVVASQPLETAQYRQQILEATHVDHLTVEVSRCEAEHESQAEKAPA